ncbi:peptide-N4-asparagine amidase [Granulicella arctica]|uniref:peptide-N4-asparagine amidase n=1 Tax=Granulicella arctica TaxID=940613 RepID=UPI0021E0AED2|nr:peptide-N4-asparagine amidase [Granulicella arctica]
MQILTSSRRLLVSSSLLLLAAGAACAQVVVVPPTLQIGSSNPATAEPPVTRPSTTPCVVPLLTNQEFGDYSGKPMSFTPPTSCHGPWAKIVLTADFTVTAGRQFDRTAQLYLGNTNIFYGTTAEPRSALSPSWHIERDVTDLSALLKTPQTGQAIVYNIVNSTYTGIIYGNAALEFYPASFAALAPAVPDLVIPISSVENAGVITPIVNNAGTLNTTADQLTQTLTLPRNVTRAYLDVISQSQSTDEFWYLNVPNDQTGNLEAYGNTPFRETEITIDGKSAGVAPVYPWIFTGGLDPYLWEPITGVQTLNFKPYRVDLTPFAGLLNDGNQHTVGVSVYNANSYFLATATLLVYTDHFKSQVNGALVSNTLTPPEPTVVEKLTTTSAGVTTGTITVASARKFAIKGYVETSLGRIETTVEQKVDFNSTGTFNVNAKIGAPEIQNMVQTSTVDANTTTRDGFLVEQDHKTISFPLTLDYSFLLNSDGTQTQVVTSDQKNILNETKSLDGFLLYESKTREAVNSTDTLQFTAAGALSAAGIGKTTATYKSSDTLGNCYSRTLTAANQKLTGVTNDKACKNQ